MTKLILLLFIFTRTLFSQETFDFFKEENNKDQAQIRASKIKSKKAILYHKGNIDSAISLYEFKYNNKGKLFEVILFGVFKVSTYVYYNQFGMDSIKDLYMNDKLFTQDRMIYESNGLLVESRSIFYKDSLSNVVYKYYYDSNKKLIEIKSCPTDSNCKTNQLFKYNLNNKLIYKYHNLFSSSDNIKKSEQEYKYFYDEKGRLIQEDFIFLWSEDSTPFTSKKYYYEGNKLIQEEIDYGVSGSVSTYYYFYNSKNNLRKKIYKSTSGKEEIYRYKYDNKGIIIEERMYDKNHELINITKYIYEFYS